MSTAPRQEAIQTIARRDLRDALSDWRTLIPLFVLSFLIPVLLQYGFRVGLIFLDDEGLNRSLVPLGLLLAGFLPASFSLVGPLEAFVGERERNTLESLLSAPISNRGLYMGKLLASSIPPVVASVIGALVYATWVLVRWPWFLSQHLTVGAALGVMVALLIKMLAMIAAALYVSCNTTSIRSANLMASFILLPMTLVIQLEALMFVQERFGVVVLLNGVLLIVGAFFLGLGMRTFNRESILAREHQALRSSGKSLTTRIGPRLYGPVLTIMRREVRDTITDWRILAPILALTLLMPGLSVAGTIFAYHNLAEPEALLRLMPFLTLLVGFLPASFSLIIALEIFVGEKERGTLESLFSMPISDTQLYLGKSLAALVPPLGASLVAITVYLAGLTLAGYSALLELITPMILFQVLLLTIAQSLAMTAGAVIISSHTSTVRLANLMASFVLIPITVIIQLEAVLMIGQRYDVLWFAAGALAIVAAILTRSGMHSFNRESILSREHLALNWGAIRTAFGGFFREIRPAGADPELAAPTLSIRRFYTQELPVVWREIRQPLVLTTLAIALSVVFAISGYEITINVLQRPLDRLIDNIGTQIPQSSLLLALQIFVGNSLRVLIAGLVSVVSFGLYGFLVPFIAYFSVAYLAAIAERRAIGGGAWDFLLGYVIPHGIVELSTALLVGALSLRLGASVTTVPPTYSVGRHMLWALALFLKVWLFVLVPLFGVAALIEGLVTPIFTQNIYG